MWGIGKPKKPKNKISKYRFRFYRFSVFSKVFSVRKIEKILKKTIRYFKVSVFCFSLRFSYFRFFWFSGFYNFISALWCFCFYYVFPTKDGGWNFAIENMFWFLKSFWRSLGEIRPKIQWKVLADDYIKMEELFLWKNIKKRKTYTFWFFFWFGFFFGFFGLQKPKRKQKKRYYLKQLILVFSVFVFFSVCKNQKENRKKKKTYYLQNIGFGFSVFLGFFGSENQKKTDKPIFWNIIFSVFLFGFPFSVFRFSGFYNFMLVLWFSCVFCFFNKK